MNGGNRISEGIENLLAVAQKGARVAAARHRACTKGIGAVTAQAGTLAAQLGVEDRVTGGCRCGTAIKAGFVAQLGVAALAGLLGPGFLGLVAARRPGVVGDVQNQNDPKGDHQRQLKITHTFSF